VNRAESQAVRHGDLLFVSGQLGDDAGLTAGRSIETQVRSSMDRVMRILESHGLGSNHILSVTFYLRDIDDLRRADAIYASYFPGGLPARTVAGVDTLPGGSLVEIAVVAGK
jgi:2-iminobutanoate/2-iminopropanoate deaminase